MPINLRTYTALFSFFVCILLGAPAFANIVLTQVEVELEGEDADMALTELLPFYEGQVTSVEAIEAEITKLIDYNIFSDVTYELEKIQGDQHILKIKLSKGKKIRAIRISGNYPILAKNIKRVLPIQTGNLFTPRVIPLTEDAILNYLHKIGYYDSKVILSYQEHKKYPLIDIKAKLKKGKTYRVGEITLSGNTVLSDRQIKGKISKGSRFRLVRLKKNLEKIKKLYAKKGYIKARVKLNKLDFHPENRRVDIDLLVQENKKLTTEFIGKTFIPVNRLKRILGLTERRSYDQFALKNSAQRLKKYYELQGFPEARISYEATKIPQKAVEVKYYIDPGKRIEIKEIKFFGNNNLSAKKLKKEIVSKESGLFSREFFHDKYLSTDVVRLLNIYKNEGYFDVTVDQPQVIANEFGDQKTIFFSIQEGGRYVLRSVQIQGAENFSSPALIKKMALKVGKPYRSKDIDKAKEALLETLYKNGYAYAKVAFNPELQAETHSVHLLIEVTLGPVVKLGRFLIEGAHLTRKKVIYKNLKIKPGDLFVYQEVLEAQLNLRKLGIFDSVRVTAVGYGAKATTVDLLITVVERKTILVNLQGGFDSRHLATGEFSFTKYNIFGTGKQINTRFIGGPKYNRGEFTFYSPRIFGASWNFSNQYFGEYEDEPNYVDVNYGGYINTLKNFGPHWTFGFREQITHTDVFEDRSNIAALGDSLFDNTFNEFSLILIFDNRDNFSDPQRGIYVISQNELNTDLSDAANNFNTLEVSVSHHYGFLKRFTLNNSLRYGHTFEITSNPRIPFNKLFFMGGPDTVRGFADDAIDPSGGTLAMIYNGELHFRIYDGVKLAGFFDAGLLQDDINDVHIDDVREAAGIGLRYFTPIGPIRLDYGFILDRRAGEPTSRLHFSFGYFF